MFSISAFRRDVQLNVMKERGVPRRDILIIFAHAKVVLTQLHVSRKLEGLQVVGKFPGIFAMIQFSACRSTT